MSWFAPTADSVSIYCVTSSMSIASRKLCCGFSEDHCMAEALSPCTIARRWFAVPTPCRCKVSALPSAALIFRILSGRGSISSTSVRFCYPRWQKRSEDSWTYLLLLDMEWPLWDASTHLLRSWRILPIHLESHWQLEPQQSRIRSLSWPAEVERIQYRKSMTWIQTLDPMTFWEWYLESHRTRRFVFDVVGLQDYNTHRMPVLQGLETVPTLECIRKLSNCEQIHPLLVHTTWKRICSTFTALLTIILGFGFASNIQLLYP